MNKFILLGVVGLLASCANSNVVDHWTCDANQPEECHSVQDGDDIAIKRIKNPSGASIERISLPTDRDMSEAADMDEAMVNSSGHVNPKAVMGTSDSNKKPGYSTPTRRKQHMGDAVEGETADAAKITSNEGLSAILPNTKGLNSRGNVLNRYRTPEELARIWIGSFIDAGGNYHPESEIFIVVREARWKE